jgi:hypothetical protein
MIGQEQVLSIALVYGSCGSCYWSFWKVKTQFTTLSWNSTPTY